MSVVEIDGVTKRFGETPALDGVSLRIEEGELFALLGPSGSGKTTLLRAIAGFVDPEAGTIRIDGDAMRDIPVHRRDIGMVFQDYALFPHMSVFDNVAFGLSVRHVARAEMAERVRAMLTLVQLEGYEERRPGQLSGGQQQRVALARALVTRPRVLLLDEPLGALDKRLRRQMQIELRQIQREVGITTVFVTHDQEEALTLSDRIAILDAGRIVQSGPPQAVYERPRTVFAADFLGDANFFTGRTDGDGRVRTSRGSELFTADVAEDTGADVILAVRPEKLRIARAGNPASDGANRLAGTVASVLYAGSTVTYRVACDEVEVTVLEQNREATPIEQGEPVTVSWRPEHYGGGLSVMPDLTLLLARPCLHVAVDMQHLFAGPTVWHTPGLADILPRVVLLARHAPGHTVFTRFVCAQRPEDATGAWRSYYERWRSVTLAEMGRRPLDSRRSPCASSCLRLGCATRAPTRASIRATSGAWSNAAAPRCWS